MTIEERIEKYKVADSDAFSMQPLQANLAQSQSSNQHDKGNNHKAPNYSSNRGRYNNNGGNYRGFHRGRGRFSRVGGRQSYQSYQYSNKPQCQLCDKYGHTALTCWHRFDTKYQDSGNSIHNHQQGKAMLAENTNEEAVALAVPETLYDPA